MSCIPLYYPSILPRKFSFIEDDYTETYKYKLDGKKLTIYDYEDDGPNVFRKNMTHLVKNYTIICTEKPHRINSKIYSGLNKGLLVS